MACNKIELIYKQTDWRPTHYVKQDYACIDPNGPDDWKSEILQHINAGEQCLLWDAFRAGADKNDGNYEFIYDGIGDFPNVRYIPRCEHHYQRKGAWHNICTGLNSMLTMAIWAVELGYDELVLVGCDGAYSTPDKDHFTADYYKGWDATYASRNGTNVIWAHEIIKKYCPVPVFNATVGGILEMYPRVKLEDYA